MLNVKKENRERKSSSASARTSTDETPGGTPTGGHSGELSASSARGSGGSSAGSSAPAVKSGWLLKQGGRWNNWKKRWVMLYPDALEFYQAKPNDKKKGDPKARVQLLAITEIDGDVEGKKKNTFELQFSSRDSIFLDASSQKDKLAWIAALREQLNAQDKEASIPGLVRRPSAAGSLRGRRLAQQRHAKEAEELEQKRSSVMDIFQNAPPEPAAAHTSAASAAAAPSSPAPKRKPPPVKDGKSATGDKHALSAVTAEKSAEEQKAADARAKVHGGRAGGGHVRKSATTGAGAGGGAAVDKKESRALERRASVERIKERYTKECVALCSELERREVVQLRERYASAAERIRAELAKRKK